MYHRYIYYKSYFLGTNYGSDRKKYVMVMSVRKFSQKCEWAPYNKYLYYLITY